MRPQPDFAAAPNRDVANADFPPDAWQRDGEYMAAFLAQAKRLVNRTIEAVYAEYGVGLPPDGSEEFTPERWEHRAQFAPWRVKEECDDVYVNNESWTTRQSLEGIARRFIHHITTGDTFKFVLGGHSAAAGHGAGFNQSYIIEASHVLEPVFAHLGVEMRAYNFAQGGMGTFQQALAGMDLRGKEVRCRDEGGSSRVSISLCVTAATPVRTFRVCHPSSHPDASTCRRTGSCGIPG